MNWTYSGRATLAGLLLLGAVQAHAVGTLYVGFSDSSEGISVRSATTLTETGSFAAGGVVSGVAAGVNDDDDNIYVTAGDTVYSYSVAGAELSSATISGATLNDVALLGSQIWVARGDGTPGLSARNPLTLAENDFFNTAFVPESIEDGFGRLYITSGDALHIYSGAGLPLEDTTTGTPGEVFVDTALSGTRLYAIIGGTTDEVSVRDPITLAEISSFALPFAAASVVAGDDDDLYFVSGANIFHYSTAGVELDSVADTTAGRSFSDITFIADPLLPAAGSVLALTDIGANSQVSQRDAATLADAGSFPIAASGSGIALGLNDDVYFASGDTLYRYDVDGTLLQSLTNTGAVYADVAIVDGVLAVVSATSMTFRNLTTLAEINGVALPFVATSITQAGPGEVYLTALNQVFRYTVGGSEVASFSGTVGFTYTDVALVKNVVYATYNASGGDGISVLDPGSLFQADVINTPIAATGISAGGSNDYYISGGDSIYHYALDEILESFTAGAGTTFPDVVYSPAGSLSPTDVVAAILPSSRSVQVGGTASAFATIINTGSVTASDCRITPRTTVPGTFEYQTTDPGTNELVGTPNTPVDIASNGSQTFLFQFVPNAEFPSTEVELNFLCANAAAAPVFEGVNTLLLSADTNLVPDVVALAATPSSPGIVDIPGTNGTGFFAVASVNVGAPGSISVTARVTDSDPNISLTLCETNPATGACINPTTPTSGAVVTNIAANATPTFSIFAAGSGDIALDPAGKRIRVEFAEETSGAVRGATSVAVRTQ